MLKDIVKLINESSILYDNENLSLPFFRINNEKEELLFFTFTVEFNIAEKKNNINIGRGFIVKIEDCLVLEQFELPKEVPYVSDRVFQSLPEIQEDIQFSYDDMIALSDNMLSCNYSVESIKLYAAAFEQYVSIQTKQAYIYISKEYFEKLSMIIYG